MTDGSRVIASPHLGDFFRAEVTGAKDSLGIDMSDYLEFYLVNLLCEYGRRGAAPTPGEEPLALLYKRALESNVPQRVQILKGLGDLALFVSGFFVEFIERSLVDVDYYVGMGGSAYNSVSNLVGSQPRGEAFAELYSQLGARFTELVDLLSEIAERSRDSSEDNTALLRMYDRWARTGSQRVRRMLLDKGLVPSEGVPTEYEQ